MKALLDLLRVGFVLSAVALSIHSAYALPPMPNFDKRLDQRGAATGLNGDQEKARSRPAARLPALWVDVDPIIGSPAWIISTEDFLSGFTETEINRAGDLGLLRDDPHRAIKAFV